MNQTPSASPYLSVIIVSRNDDHGSRMFERTRICCGSLLHQLESFGIPSEFLLVEWLPPEGRPRLKDIFAWPDNLKNVQLRILTVSSRQLRNYEYTEDFPIRDLTPWNVGIRRARGEFILSTVADTLISDELIRHIAERKLDPGAIYRIDRCDVDRKVLDVRTHDERLAFCEKNIVDMQTLNPLKFLLKPGHPVVHDKAPGDFILMSKESWNQIRGFPQGIIPGGDNVVLYMACLAGIRHQVLAKPFRLYHIDHDSFWKSPRETAVRRRLARIGVPFWLIDIAAKFTARIAPGRSDLDRKGVKLSGSEANRIIKEMVRGRMHYMYNDEQWGLGDMAIEEHAAGK